jgi:hypothetical protein
MVGIIPCRTPPAMLKKSPAVIRTLVFERQNGNSVMFLTKPDNDELDAESISRLLAVVLNNLRREDDNPAGN